MENGKDVFMIGPGFIGWNVLDVLVEQGYNVTALTRREEHAEQIRHSGAKAVMGGLSDLQLVEDYTAESNIVYQVATGDNLDLENAILTGVRRRAQLGKNTIYIHTSGAKVLADDAYGMFKSDKIYDDDGPDSIDTVADDAPHRDVDLFLVNAQKELNEHFRVAIMLPPEVYGYDAKHDRLSMLFPNITRYALKHGYPPMIGQGLSVETQIHVMDLARGYVQALHYLEEASPADAVANPYWLCENGMEFSWKEAAEVVGKALHDRGLIKNPNPQEPPEEFWSELSGKRTRVYMGLNCRGRAVRLRKLGWEAREKGIWASYIEDELPIILSRIQRSKETRSN